MFPPISRVSVKLPFPLSVNKKDVWVLTPESYSLPLSEISFLKRVLSEKGYRLQCYETIFGNISAEALAYNFPGVAPELLSKRHFVMECLDGLNFIRNLRDNEALLVRYTGIARGEVRVFEAFIVPVLNSALSKDAVQYYINELVSLKRERKDDGIRFSKVIPEEPEEKEFGRIDLDKIHESVLERVRKTPEEVFTEDLEKAEKETVATMRDLFLKGTPITVLESWLTKAIEPSRVHIDNQYRIFLPDYNVEIEMTQLAKSVYFFFLWKDIRLSLNQLVDYREEFLKFYMNLTIFEDRAANEATIDRLINPKTNSFSEVCANIKKAFLKKIAPRFAETYYIHGEQNYSKGIDLDRSLVTWDRRPF